MAQLNTDFNRKSALNNFFIQNELEISQLKSQSNRTLLTYNIVKIIITVAILTWLIYTSYQINYDPVKYEKYAKIHLMWFGQTSPILIIFNIWIFSIILFFAIPIFKNIINILLSSITGIYNKQ